jgi:hypothetical protein
VRAQWMAPVFPPLTQFQPFVNKILALPAYPETVNHRQESVLWQKL